MNKIKINNPVIVINSITQLPIEDDNKNVFQLDFKLFMKTIVFADARWDLSLNHLKILMNLIDKVKSCNDEIILNDNEYKIVCEIIKQPTTKYNHLYANALIIHADSILNSIICE